MATKYAGQNAMNKLMQLVKTALSGKLDKSGGTITGNLKVNGDLEPVNGLTTIGGVYAQTVSTPVLALHDNGVAGANASINVSGAGAVEVTVPDGDKRAKARVKVGTPTDDEDATPKAYVDTKVSGLQTADQVQAAISSAITGVYTPKGTIAFKSLPTAAAGNKGWVYNISDAFTTTAAFVEGAGHSYGAGTNVVCVDAGSGSYKWDVLAGTIDLTELTADEVQTLWDSI